MTQTLINNMIEDTYVSFEQAKALKELGFPQDKNSNYLFYDEEGSLRSFHISPTFKLQFKRPTLSLVQKWLREEKNIHLVINEDRFDLWSIWGHEIKPLEFSVFERIGGFTSYEQALSAGIDKCIELLK